MWVKKTEVRLSVKEGRPLKSSLEIRRKGK